MIYHRSNPGRAAGIVDIEDVLTQEVRQMYKGNVVAAHDLDVSEGTVRFGTIASKEGGAVAGLRPDCGRRAAGHRAPVTPMAIRAT